MEAFALRILSQHLTSGETNVPILQHHVAAVGASASIGMVIGNRSRADHPRLDVVVQLRHEVVSSVGDLVAEVDVEVPDVEHADAGFVLLQIQRIAELSVAVATRSGRDCLLRSSVQAAEFQVHLRAARVGPGLGPLVKRWGKSHRRGIEQ
ncbi:MAG: hypothetical protein ABEL04_09760, partial [Salinibacter sp.]